VKEEEEEEKRASTMLVLSSIYSGWSRVVKVSRFT
jgi:hypothetical protein